MIHEISTFLYKHLFTQSVLDHEEFEFAGIFVFVGKNKYTDDFQIYYSSEENYQLLSLYVICTDNTDNIHGHYFTTSNKASSMLYL